MADSNSHQKQQIIFPADNSTIIARLLEKYGLTESPKDVFEKARNGKESFGRIIAKTIRAIAEEKLPFSELSAILQEKLNLSKKRAEEFAQDIKTELLDLVKKPKKEMILSTSENYVETEPSPPKKDIYREPVK